MVELFYENEEAKRLSCLHSYDILDTPPESAFDDLTRLAAEVTEAPIALVSLIDQSRQWFKSRIGLDLPEAPRDIAFCAKVIESPQPLVIEDALEDPCFRENPFVIVGAIRFYAGVPLIGPEGYALGTLCVADHVPRKISSSQLEHLTILARQVMRELIFRKTLKKVSESEALLGCITDSALDGILTISPDGKVLFANRRFTEMWNIPDELFQSRDDQRLLDYVLDQLVDPASFLRKVKTLYENPSATSQDELQLKDGRTFDRYSAPVYSLDRTRFYGRVWYFRDVTAKVQAARQIQRTSDLFFKLPALVASVRGPEMRFDFANEAFRALMGNREIIGKPLQEAIRLDEVTLKILRDVARTGRRFINREHVVEAEWLEKGKVSRRYFTLVFEPIRGMNEEVEGVLCIAFDVTENKNLEARLRSSEQMAALGTLAAGVAHEINNPLGYVMLSLEQLARQQVDLDLRGVVMRAWEGAERIQKIVKDLKTFSRQPPNDDRIAVSTVQKVLDSTLRMVSTELRDRATIEKHYHPVPVIVRAPEGRLAQVFVNLIVNAAHAIPEDRSGKHRIEITLRTEEEMAVIEITDTGVGISAEHLSRIFEPFYTTKEPGSGTGLGLFISHGIVESLKGTIEVKSEPGKGTTFRVKLPLAPREEARRALTGERKAPFTRRLRILVIDDERFLLDSVVSAFINRHDVVSETSSEAALRRIYSEDFDLILCDLMMPELTGMDLHAELLQTRPEVADRMLFMTGGAFTSEAQKFVTQFPKRTIDKPFTERQLLDFIEEAVRLMEKVQAGLT